MLAHADGRHGLRWAFAGLLRSCAGAGAVWAHLGRRSDEEQHGDVCCVPHSQCDCKVTQEGPVKGTVKRATHSGVPFRRRGSSATVVLHSECVCAALDASRVCARKRQRCGAARGAAPLTARGVLRPRR
eukprot:2699416-Prymnesium_polylepis.2